MSKAGRIILLVMAIFAIAGANSTTFAKTQASTCSSSLVSTPFCEGTPQSICASPTTFPKKQIQAAAVVVKPVVEERVEVNPEATTTPAPTMPALKSEIAADNTNLDSDKIFGLVNQYRGSLGLSPFEKDNTVCELAQTRSNEIIGEISSGALHSGLYNRNLPYWIWENAKYGSNEEGTVAWWLSSPVHHQSIVGDYKFSCVRCTGSYCSQLFTSFTPK